MIQTPNPQFVRNEAAPGPRTAFTLVELLVVIAIIAILAKLLLSAIAGAKGQALRIACTNNQKQLMLAFVMYEHDYNDYFPWCNWDSAPWSGIKGWLYTGPLSGTTKASSGALWPYLKTPLVYWCPLDLSRTNSTACPPGDPGATYKSLFQARNNKMGSYICNGGVSGYGKLPGSARQNTYKTFLFPPTYTLLWESDETVPFYFNDGASTPPEGFSRRHDQGATIGSVGGQVIYYQYTKWEKLLNTQDFYWSP